MPFSYLIHIYLKSMKYFLFFYFELATNFVSRKNIFLYIASRSTRNEVYTLIFFCAMIAPIINPAIINCLLNGIFSRTEISSTSRFFIASRSDNLFLHLYRYFKNLSSTRSVPLSFQHGRKLDFLATWNSFCLHSDVSLSSAVPILRTFSFSYSIKSHLSNSIFWNFFFIKKLLY